MELIRRSVVREGLVTVLPRVEQNRAVEPHGPVAAVLEEQLVEVDVLEDETVVGTACLYVGDADVDGLARQVLRATDTVDTGIDGLGAETAVDVDRAELTVQRLQQHAAQICEGRQLERIGGVVDAVGFGPCGARHLVVAEMLGEHKILSFHNSQFTILNSQYSILTVFRPDGAKVGTILRHSGIGSRRCSFGGRPV